jgi:hypothetical protein
MRCNHDRCGAAAGEDDDLAILLGDVPSMDVLSGLPAAKRHQGLDLSTPVEFEALSDDSNGGMQQSEDEDGSDVDEDGNEYV